jgi:hypothetical protein
MRSCSPSQATSTTSSVLRPTKHSRRGLGAAVSNTDETLEDAYRTGARRVLDDCDRDYWQLVGSSAHAV